MYKVSTCHRAILTVVEEEKKILITISLHSGTSYEARETLINYVICKYGAFIFKIWWRSSIFI